MMRVLYDHRLKPIDEQLVKLIAERIRKSRGTNGYPSKEQVDRWCQEYQVDVHVIASVFAAMSNPWRAPRLAVSPQNLLHIIPIMHKIRREDITYQITHIEQYIDCSLVYLDIYTRANVE
ncbi:hypothetical protein GCM10025857_13650 [Alicyclobacillus contaminans]|uniref:hypothetical protein n=1 Tax=Alicyclobacillus contaminans TaxID=392016 RepID=UPI000423C1BC|nr:hypothetical protein [Alicyclobacillus contaminans]GMA50008.1 hypothetical protein GCM10025857_13650 [Alicyclobacillus contaminans]